MAEEEFKKGTGGVVAVIYIHRGPSMLLGGDKNGKGFGREKGERSEVIGTSIKVFNFSLQEMLSFTPFYS